MNFRSKKRNYKNVTLTKTAVNRDTLFYELSSECLLELGRLKTGSTSTFRRKFRRWRRLLKCLPIGAVDLTRAELIASRAVEQAVRGEKHAACYDFRRAVLLIRNRLVEHADAA